VPPPTPQIDHEERVVVTSLRGVQTSRVKKSGLRDLAQCIHRKVRQDDGRPSTGGVSDLSAPWRRGSPRRYGLDPSTRPLIRPWPLPRILRDHPRNERMRDENSFMVPGRSGRCGWNVHFRAVSRRCHRGILSGVTAACLRTGDRVAGPSRQGVAGGRRSTGRADPSAEDRVSSAR
jgi:hypothetical protein